MKRLIITAAIALFLVGCETTVEYTDPLGNEVKMSETAYLAKINSESMQNLGGHIDPCAEFADIDDIAELSEGGEIAVGRALEMCNIRVMLGMAMGVPVSAHGEISQQNVKAMIAIEQGQSEKVKSMYSFGAFGLGAYFGYRAIDSLASQAGDEFGDVNIKASNSGDAGGGEEGLPGGQERNMNILVGGSGNNGSNQSGASNTQATAEKATSVDNPIVNGGPNNAIVNDADANGNDGRVF